MRTTERDKLLFVLAVTSGSADSWSYMGLGHAFVANMTGNTVLLGISIFGERQSMLPRTVALAFYAVGVAIGTYLTRKMKQGSIWAKSITGVLFLESFLLMLSAIAWISFRGTPDPEVRLVLLGVVATAIGLQSGAMLRLKLPGIVTTYITGTWTTLVSGLVLFDSGRKDGAENAAAFEDRLIIQAVFLAIYFTSAVAAGLAFHYMPVLIGLIAGFPILIVAVYGAIRGA
jgi:uncharacterized membrane protein YoaK (UPF0700 family)